MSLEPGSGPYSRIRILKREIYDCKYELGLISQGIRGRLGKKRLEEIIAANRARIRQIKAEQKTKKK